MYPFHKCAEKQPVSGLRRESYTSSRRTNAKPSSTRDGNVNVFTSRFSTSTFALCAADHLRLLKNSTTNKLGAAYIFYMHAHLEPSDAYFKTFVVDAPSIRIGLGGDIIEYAMHAKYSKK